VHPSVIGRRIDITADADRVAVSCNSRPVAGHNRCWAQHQSITDPAHRQAASDLRTAHRLASIAPIRTEVEARNLTDYDRMFGLDGEVPDAGRQPQHHLGDRLPDPGVEGPIAGGVRRTPRRAGPG
jgi:hypothetical protein